MERLYERWIDPQKIFARHQRENDLGYYSSYAQEIMQVVSFFGRVPSTLRFFDFGMMQLADASHPQQFRLQGDLREIVPMEIPANTSS